MTQTIQPPAGSSDLLFPEVTLFVHQVDVAAHPTVPAGTWRWAVHVGGGRPDDLRGCVQADGQPTEGDAWLAGEQVAVAVAGALRTFGIPADYRRMRLLRDPVPAGADRITYFDRRS